MKKAWLFIGLILLLLAPAGAMGEEVATSTAADQTGVEVTVYNSDLALVKDGREIQLKEGRGELRFADVASAIRPETVHVKSLNAPDSLAILEQNYEYDLISPEKLLEKFVGRKIKMEVWNEFSDKKEIVEGTLLSANNGLVFDIGGQIYLNYPGLKIVPSIPDNLFARPTLAWLYENTSPEKHRVEVSYLTRGMTWKADYIMVLDGADKFSDLTGWVTVDNRSGAAYKDAKLKLVAGEVNQVQSSMGLRMYQSAPGAAPMAAPAFEEESFFEYHIYNLGRNTTLGNNQTKQISLLEAFNVPVRKEYQVHGQRSYFTAANQQGRVKQKINVTLNFNNSKENNLGIPLPKGVIRLYKEDSSGALQFIGEDRVDHTPRNEGVSLKAGEPFDVVAERRQVTYKKLADNLHDSSWELIVKNRKEDEDVTVSFFESVPGDWTVKSSSQDYIKTDAFTIRYDIHAKPDEEVVVTFSLRVRT